jgi:hypothetical protein
MCNTCHRLAIPVLGLLLFGQAVSAQEPELLRRTLNAIFPNGLGSNSGRMYVVPGVAAFNRSSDSSAVAGLGGRGKLINQPNDVLACGPKSPSGFQQCHFTDDDADHSQIVTIAGVRRTSDSVIVTVWLENWFKAGPQWNRGFFERFVAFPRLPGNALGQPVISRGVIN